MLKKLLTYSILVLGLVQGANLAFADSSSQRIGGVGHGKIATLDGNTLEVLDSNFGNLTSTLNGVLALDKELNGTYSGNASFNATEQGVPTIFTTSISVPFSCTVTPFPNVNRQIDLDCTYDTSELPPGLTVTSNGQCYLSKNKRKMACNILFNVVDASPEFPSHLTTAVAFPKMF